MDIIKFINYDENLDFTESVLVNGIHTKLWVERYFTPGEFKLVLDPEVDPEEVLPIGSLISHTKTLEVMIVEDHSIIEKKNMPPVITVTGRSFESFFNHRAFGHNTSNSILYSGVTFYKGGPITEIASDILKLSQSYGDDYMSGLWFSFTLDAESTSWQQMRLKSGPGLDVASQYLRPYNIGVKTVRPNAASHHQHTLYSNRLKIYVHIGQGYLADEDPPMFTYLDGDIESAEYFWSNREYKTFGWCHGTAIQASVPDALSGYDRRIAFAAGQPSKEYENPYPGNESSEIQEIVEDYTELARNARGAGKLVEMVDVEIAENRPSKRYRVDYDIGDYFKILGKYNISKEVRVIEYVEVEDMDGERGHPVLTNYEPSTANP